ncbi:hypothetical protein CCM_05476 [Cordyceps militaris CM01]|uniref:Uncharacterized protein n=1 Tax=Cordyceps militaris (strain CM01) TaxID=983644 RepID=G3JJY1_CORMM|nr:uncharacterized protein CCM_05476 [Cordyceps militaris CM01]EGX91318.1 hypothetical protein CCM_05476 [Cordyceps militaris CM01]
MDPNQLPLPQASGTRRKRKAEPHRDNERLSKRLSLLNLERDGTKIYVPVESPLSRPSKPPPTADDANEAMRLDDTKHKVYIYNIDEELAEDSEPDEAKLVFLPDIEKRLRESRIPPHVLANSDGELAGMQLVLYSDPASLSVPEEKDGVRKAILDARRRHRARQAGDDAEQAENPAVGAGTKNNQTTGQDASDDIEMDID